MRRSETGVVERFRPTSGRLIGSVALVIAVGALVVTVVDWSNSAGPALICVILLFAVLVWEAMLKPGLAVTTDSLVMRNMTETVTIPLGAIEEMTVRQVLAVRVGDKRHVSPVVGRSFRQTLRSNRAGHTAAPLTSYPDYVEERLRQLVADDLAKRGIKARSSAQVALASGVRRDRAWADIAVMAALGVAFVVALLV